MRSDRILGCMHRVVSHDLPNQLVAIQGLLQLFLLEEADRLSTDGREYLGRLQSAAGRAGELVRFLKELGRVNSHALKVETFALADLLGEVQGLLRQRRTSWVITCPEVWFVPTIAGDLQVYVQALHELFTGLPNRGEGHASVQSARADGSVELTFSLAPETATRADPATLERSLELVLAREWLARCGAHLILTTPVNHALSIVVQIPNP